MSAKLAAAYATETLASSYALMHTASMLAVAGIFAIAFFEIYK
jgi:hypothetical protein